MEKEHNCADCAAAEYINGQLSSHCSGQSTNGYGAKKAANIALSDGLQLLALEINEGTPHVPFFSPCSTLWLR